ncbi:MAG TPA: aminotransferase class III-fold pyridoxal phosphate-dependent enzyme, partial [Woeseiaceae bacterium]|nr:aminotransferase class III-fold pyridoxal phosphate-dependent enzyme [Woeseiaceae bacterium]
VNAVTSNGGFAHGYTYAGNPLACTAGLAVTHELLEQELMANAERQGRNLRARLAGLMQRYPFIGDVRGKGLLLAFELVSDRETMQPLDPALNAHLALVEEAYSRGLIIYSRRTRGGTVGDHFMVCPPLTITDAEIEELMSMLTASLDAFAAAHGLPVCIGAGLTGDTDADATVARETGSCRSES